MLINVGRTYIPVDKITSVYPETDEHGRHKTIVLTSDGERLSTSMDIEDIDAALQSVVKADAGYYFLTHYYDEGNRHFLKIPIVAWRISAGTAIGIAVEECSGPILCPDGSVISPEDRHWDSFDEWLESVPESE
jgi:hypothetical protein